MRLLLLLLVLGLCRPDPDLLPLWTYEDQNSWPGTSCAPGVGLRQSPINIQTAAVIKDVGGIFIRNGPLTFAGYGKVLTTGINNGHTVQFTTEGEEALRPVMAGGPLEHQYRLEQMHFHWLSEHALDDVKLPLEIHLVHVQSNLSMRDALRQSDGIAVIGVFCEVRPTLTAAQLDAAEALMRPVPQLAQLGARLAGLVLDISKLLRAADDYYAYAGSLTTPGCDEAVFWMLLKEPFLITKQHVQILNLIGGGRNNGRRLQSNYLQVFSPGGANFTKAFGNSKKIARPLRLLNILRDAFREFFTTITDATRDAFTFLFSTT